MWLSRDGQFKVRVIVIHGHTDGTIELFRWSHEAGGWVWVADYPTIPELARYLPLEQLDEFREVSDVPPTLPRLLPPKVHRR